MAEHADPRDLLEVAVAVAGDAADLARTQRAAGVEGVGTKSTDTDLVTAADRAVERLIVAALRRHRPADTIVGEEYGAAGGHRPGEGAGAGVRWVVDPIDGTVNYVYGIPLYAVSIAAQVAGATVAGVVRNAATGEEWRAVAGGGAWQDGTPLHGSTVSDLSRALVATGFGYAAADRAWQARVVAAVLPRVRDIRRMGAAALDLCYAAQGRVDAYYESGLNHWDYAAGALIAAEAGLVVGGLRGAPAGPALVIAAPPALFRTMHDLLDEVWPSPDAGQAL